MRFLPRAVIALVAVCAFCAYAAASASAYELPEFSAKTGFTGSSGAMTFETGKELSITCKKTTTEATATTTEAGSFHLDASECAVAGVKCNSSGDAAGVILLKGEWDLVSEEGRILLLYSPSETSVSCSGLGTTVTLKGKFLTAITPVEEVAKKFTLKAAETKGKQESSEYENTKREALKAELLASVNGGAFERIGVKANEDSISTEKEVNVITITLIFGAIGETQKVTRIFNGSLKVLAGTTRYINGGFFTINKGCVGMERPPCAFEFEYNGPGLEIALTIYLAENESPVGSGNKFFQEFRLR